MNDDELDNINHSSLDGIIVSADMQGRVYELTPPNQLSSLLGLEVQDNELNHLPLMEVIKRIGFFSLAESYKEIQDESSFKRSIDFYKQCSLDSRDVIVHVSLQKGARGHYTLSISDSTEMDQQRRKARRHLELYKDALAGVSHDLGNDIFTLQFCLKGLIRSLENGGDITSSRERNLLEIVVSEMASKFKDYMDLTKLENGIYTPTIEEVAVYSSVIEPINRKYQQSKDVKICFGEHSTQIIGLDPTLHCDADSFRAVYDNIISNALKYAKDPQINIDYHEDDEFAYISVKNTGSFITENESRNLFRRFSRLDRLKDQAKGTGLGLYISRTRLRASGGNLTVSSDGESFTEFTLKIKKYQQGEI